MGVVISLKTRLQLLSIIMDENYFSGQKRAAVSRQTVKVLSQIYQSPKVDNIPHSSKELGAALPVYFMPSAFRSSVRVFSRASLVKEP